MNLCNFLSYKIYISIFSPKNFTSQQLFLDELCQFLADSIIFIHFALRLVFFSKIVCGIRLA